MRRAVRIKEPGGHGGQNGHTSQGHLRERLFVETKDHIVQGDAAVYRDKHAVYRVSEQDQTQGKEQKVPEGPLFQVFPVKEKRAKNQEHGRRVIPALPHQQQVRYRQRHQQRRENGDSCLSGHPAGQDVKKQDVDHAEQGEREPRAESAAPENRERSGGNIKLSPRMVSPGVIFSVAGPYSRVDKVFAVKGLRVPVLKGVFCEDRRLRLVLPQVLVAQVGKKQYRRDDQDDQNGNIFFHSPLRRIL